MRDAYFTLVDAFENLSLPEAIMYDTENKYYIIQNGMPSLTHQPLCSLLRDLLQLFVFLEV